MEQFLMKEGDKLESVHVAFLVNKGTKTEPDWLQISKTTENTINCNAETEDRKFIVDKTATTVVKGYKPSINNPLSCFKGSPDYEYFWPKFKKLPTGAEANEDFLIVFLNDETEVKTGDDVSYKFGAWRSNATVIYDNLSGTDGILTFNANFNGGVEVGEVTISDGKPTYTKAA